MLCVFSVTPLRPGAGANTSMGGRTGVRVLPYLDDFLFIFCSKEQAGAGSVWMRAVLDSLGLTANPKEGDSQEKQPVGAQAGAGQVLRFCPISEARNYPG